MTVDEADDATSVSIHWPFDRSTDEWISVSVTLENAQIRATKLQSDEYTIPGVAGRLSVRRESSTSYSLDAEGQNSLGPVSAQFSIPTKLAEDLRARLNQI